MKYSVLLTNKELELPLFLKGLESEIDIGNYHITDPNNYWSNVKYYLSNTNRWNYPTSLAKITLLNLDLYISLGFLMVKENGLYRILLLESSDKLYVDKKFEEDYKKLYLKLKWYIQKNLDSDKDVVYTNNCGKNSFYQYEPPKFRSISERQEFGNKLLEEFYTS